jgi:hypothetical protein
MARWRCKYWIDQKPTNRQREEGKRREREKKCAVREREAPCLEEDWARRTF